MKIILDTHILVWFHTADKRLDQQTINLLTDSRNTIYYSPLSIWESEIKHQLHPDIFPFSGRWLDDLCQTSGMIILPLMPEHIFLLGTLHYSESAPSQHKDPFDKMLICQAKAENMKFCTHDNLLPFYGEDCIMYV